MIKLVGEESNKLVREGKWKEFNKHAVLVTEGHYIKNRKHGLWREYYDHTGSIMIEENYKHGIQHGKFSSYHPNGQVWSEGNFQNGLREGFFKIYDEAGKHIRKLLFITDIQIEDIEEHTMGSKTT